MDALEEHAHLKGKIIVKPKVEIKTKKDLSIYYTPGVAEVCHAIHQDKSKIYDYTMKGNAVAIVTDGTRILGLGNIGPEAGLPVMEGKAMIMSQFADIDAFPICLDTTDENKIVEIVKALKPVFGAINLEDIETPKVFRIYDRLSEEMDIPVFHDDQYGTGMVVLAGLINAMKILGIKKETAKVGIVGCGSAGYGVAQILDVYGFKNVICFDSKGAIYKGRNDLIYHKKKIAELINQEQFKGKIDEFKNADILIAASRPESVPLDVIKNMNKPNIVFSLANPLSEISPEDASELGVDIFGTGRSDLPNQVNNAVVFPGFLRALLDYRIKKISLKMYVAAAEGVANTVKNPTKDYIIPSAFDKNLVGNIKEEVKKVVI